jgi:hypothetical protein
MELWWYDTDGKIEELGENIVPVPLVHQKSLI